MRRSLYVKPNSLGSSFVAYCGVQHAERVLLSGNMEWRQQCVVIVHLRGSAF